jgi:hypothetical protein
MSVLVFGNVKHHRLFFLMMKDILFMEDTNYDSET